MFGICYVREQAEVPMVLFVTTAFINAVLEMQFIS